MVARALDPQVGKYQSSYSAESQVFQGQSATMSALIALVFLVVASWTVNQKKTIWPLNYM